MKSFALFAALSFLGAAAAQEKKLECTGAVTTKDCASLTIGPECAGDSPNWDPLLTIAICVAPGAASSCENAGRCTASCKCV